MQEHVQESEHPKPARVYTACAAHAQRQILKAIQLEHNMRDIFSLGPTPVAHTGPVPRASAAGQSWKPRLAHHFAAKVPLAPRCHHHIRLPQTRPALPALQVWVALLSGFTHRACISQKPGKPLSICVGADHTSQTHANSGMIRRCIEWLYSTCGLT